MKVTLTHDGKSVELDLTAEQMTALGLKEEKKKTGYERVERGCSYWFYDAAARIFKFTEFGAKSDSLLYNAANYYTDENLANANARADRLMWELRRFAAENGGIPSVEDWNNTNLDKYEISYEYDVKKLTPSSMHIIRSAGITHFASKDAAVKAIEKFHDELIWYFTEYEAMLR